MSGAVIAELAEALDLLIRDELPPLPPPAHWFYGLEGGPQTT